MRILLIGLTLSVVATAAQAQWVLVTVGDNGDKFYADPTTKSRSGNVVRIWALQDYLKPDVIFGKLSYSDQVYLRFDCVERTRQILQENAFVGRMGTGESLGSSAKPGNKSFVAPGTAGNTMLNFACK